MRRSAATARRRGAAARQITTSTRQNPGPPVLVNDVQDTLRSAPDNDRVTQRPLPTRRCEARRHLPTEHCAQVPLPRPRSLDRPDAARHAGSPDASMTTATIFSKIVPRTSRKEVHRHKA